MNNSYNNYNIKPYKARNFIKSSQTSQTVPLNGPEVMHESVQQPQNSAVGYINVGVYTASYALPVPNAVVTIYHTYDDGEEHVVYQQITDENGRVPTMAVPVVYEGPGQQTEYDYSTYNLRVEASGFYTFNLLDIEVFPNITSCNNVNLIPTPQGVTPDSPDQTFIIPGRP